MSPAGVLVGLTQSELNVLRSSALSRIASGERTSVSGGGKTGSKQWSMSAIDLLREIVYAEQQNGTRPPRAQKVVQILNPQYVPSTTVTITLP